MIIPGEKGFNVTDLKGNHYLFCHRFDAGIEVFPTHLTNIQDSFYGRPFLLYLCELGSLDGALRDLYLYARPHTYLLHKKNDWDVLAELVQMLETEELRVWKTRDALMELVAELQAKSSSVEPDNATSIPPTKPVVRRRQAEAGASENQASAEPTASTHETENTVAQPAAESSETTITETYGSNEAIWTVDEKGRPISVEAKLDSTYNEARSSAEKKLQANVGGEARLGDDDGGHLIGHRFMSDQGLKNLFPQNANLNRGAYKKMENEWADWTDEGYEVRLVVELDPPGSDRPNDIMADYSVYDSLTGERVFKRRHRFTNTNGEDFERMSKSDMKELRE